MKLSAITVATFAGGLLICAPAFAQSTPGSTPSSSSTLQKQHTDGGDSPSNPNAFGSGTAQKQHTDGGDSPYNPNAFGSGTAQKQHTDGGDSPSNIHAFEKH